jgi:hypothetical protein
MVSATVTSRPVRLMIFELVARNLSGSEMSQEGREFLSSLLVDHFEQPATESFALLALSHRPE